ncbi:unnamed protein product [Prorocentrum cordatum]|uniref:Uncharacterized protein n=1 Tax=Prorocentrum cordatum TaxID=2364126 RepID=A0ABN9WLM3_9DINO|nr:unnamed protein product [Polarella glacialis]
MRPVQLATGDEDEDSGSSCDVEDDWVYSSSGSHSWSSDLSDSDSDSDDVIGIKASRRTSRSRTGRLDVWQRAAASSTAPAPQEDLAEEFPERWHEDVVIPSIKLGAKILTLTTFAFFLFYEYGVLFIGYLAGCQGKDGNYSDMFRLGDDKYYPDRRRILRRIIRNSLVPSVAIPALVRRADVCHHVRLAVQYYHFWV